MPADVIIDPTNGQIYWNDGTGTPQSISIKGDALNAISFVGYSGSYSPGSAPGGAQTLATFNDSSTSTFVPGTTNFELGSGTLRWKFFGSTGNFSDNSISSSLLNGALIVNGGIAISGNASIGQSLNFYNTAATFYTGFKAGTISANTLYTLPTTYPATGTSILQSDTSGVMSWVPLAASSSSGGTVYSATVGQLAFYGATGNTVGGASGVTYNPSTGILFNTHITESISTSTGALVITGGVGIGGSLNVAGPTKITNTSGTAFNVADRVTINTSNNSEGLNISSFFSYAFNVQDKANNNRFTIDVSNNKTYLSGNSASHELRIYHSNQSTYTGFAASSTGTVTYILPAGDGSAGQALFTAGTGRLYWATPTGGSSSGSTGVNPGGQYQIGYYSATGASIDGSSTFTNNTSTGVVNITHGTVSNSPTTGALTVSGGVGIGGSLFVGGTGSSISGVRLVSGAITAGAWNGTVIGTLYGGTGANLSSSTGILTVSSGTVSASTTSSAISSALSDETGSGSLVFGTTPTFTTSVVTGDLTFAVFNTTATTINAFGAATTISLGASTGTATFNSTTNATSTASGALVVKGGAGIANTLFVGGMIRSGSNTFSKSFSLGDVSLDNGSTIDTPAITYYWGNNTNLGTDVYSDGIGSTRYRLVYNLNESGGREVFTIDSVGNLRLHNSTGANYFGLRYSGSATTTYTLPPSTPAGTAVSVLQSDYTGVMSWVPMVSGGSGSVNSGTATFAAYYATTSTTISENSNLQFTGSGVSVGGNVQSSSTTTGSLQVRGGFAITGNAFIGGTTVVTNTTASASSGSGALLVAGGFGLAGNAFIGGTINVPSASTSSISSVNFSNGIVSSGTWSGTVITALYGGTGFNNYSVGDILYAATGSSFGKLPANANVGYVLTSNGANAAPSYQAVPAAAASSVAVLPVTVNQSFFVTAVSASSGTGLGLSTITSFVVNPSTNIVSLSGLAVTALTASTSANSGALIITAGASVGQSLSIGGSLNIFNGSNYAGFRYAGAANTTYTLPANSPQSSTGTSVLASTIDGTMRWVGMSAGGSGSPGGSDKQIQYNASSSFSGASGFEYTTGGIAVTVSVFAPSGTGYTAGMWVHAINGSTTRVGIGLSNPQFELEINGEISATNKSFVIDHPTKSGMKLRYGSLEGPENGVYVRGELKGTNIIEVPDHWIGLVHSDSYTVHLTPIGRFAHLYVEKIENYNVYISDNMMCPIHCYYSVWAERKDIPKLITEY